MSVYNVSCTPDDCTRYSISKGSNKWIDLERGAKCFPNATAIVIVYTFLDHEIFKVTLLSILPIVFLSNHLCVQKNN